VEQHSCLFASRRREKPQPRHVAKVGFVEGPQRRIAGQGAGGDGQVDFAPARLPDGAV